MANVEPRLCTILVGMGHACKPLSVTNMIAVANELIKYPGIEDEIKSWKTLHMPNHNNSELSYSWYRNFRKRFAHKLVAQPGRGFGNLRHLWCTYYNFRQMYDDIYKIFDDHNIAEVLKVPVHMNREGILVD